MCFSKDNRYVSIIFIWITTLWIPHIFYLKIASTSPRHIRIENLIKQVLYLMRNQSNIFTKSEEQFMK